MMPWVTQPGGNCQRYPFPLTRGGGNHLAKEELLSDRGRPVGAAVSVLQVGGSFALLGVLRKPGGNPVFGEVTAGKGVEDRMLLDLCGGRCAAVQP